MKRFALLLLLLPGIVRADGVVNADGFVQSIVDGVTYYVSPTSQTLYTQTSVRYWQPGYYSYGCWIPGYYFYRTDYVPVKVNLQAPNAEVELIRAFRARDQAVLAVQREKARIANLSGLATTLGLNAAIPNYGAGLFDPVLLTNVAAVGSGNTAYGYPQIATNSLTLSATGVDDAVLAQALSQATLDALTLGDKAHARLANSYDRKAELTERVQRILALAAGGSQLATASANAVKPKADVKVTTTTQTPVVPTVVQPIVQPKVAFLSLPGPSQCVRCHGNGQTSGGFDITKFNPDAASVEDVNRIVSYISPNNTDPKKSCGTASGRTKIGWRELAQFIRK
jgi:hypothetical protein